jgi:hypothetical protein
MPAPDGFAFTVRGDEVVIRHHGRPATTLRGRRAADFLDHVEVEDPQLLMARVTGNYRRGNERQARSHARNARHGGGGS